jgi:hypothetical protein
MTGSTQPRDQSSSRAAADSRPLSSRVRKRQLRVDRARLPVRPSRCRKDATVPGTSIWMTRAKSPTSIPSSSVLVETMTQSRASANASSERRRSATESEACDKNVVTPLARRLSPSFSTCRRDSQNTRRFSPRCRAAITLAAFSRDPT